MEQKSRLFSDIEKQQLRIAKNLAEKILTETFNWSSLLGLCFVFFIFVFAASQSGYWLWILIAVVLFVMLVNIPYNFKAKKRAAMQRYDFAEDYLLKDRVEVECYTCSAAIVFELEPGDGRWIVLQINEAELLFYYTFNDYDRGLPNTAFEIYSDTKLEGLFGRSVTIKGQTIPPIVIKPELSELVWDVFPDHLDIIEGTVESFLNDLERFSSE
jgi:hypothetical protein